jgi:hypothetical protein
VTEWLEGSHALLVTTHHLPVDQTGPHLEVVHGLDHEREARSPVVPPAGDEPNAHGVAPGHEPIAVMLDLVNPVGAARRLVGWGWETGFNKRSTRHVAYLGGPTRESSHLGRSGDSIRAALCARHAAN